jgi:hypothetical protein
MCPDASITRLAILGELPRNRKALISRSGLLIFGGTCGGRTHDKRIKSPLLYQLS